jgi:hypothetical protein
LAARAGEGRRDNSKIDEFVDKRQKAEAFRQKISFSLEQLV